ncbi:superoxide dismutase [Streptomyces sp. NPDC048387]|uniref:superoxide dismutase n=1 Tax=Streptomyces sp. NPDC048387 TaxID=3365542 RepID=UPI00371CAFA4
MSPSTPNVLRTRLNRLALGGAAALCATVLAASPALAAPTVGTAASLPGYGLYPESITQDPASGDLFVSAYGDGSVLRLPAGGTQASVFLPAGADGRSHAAGVKADRSGRLWVSGGTDRSVTVYDDTTGVRVARFHIPFASGGVNDLTFGPDGTAYLTDSFNPAVYRVTPQQLTDARTQGTDTALTTWRDLTGTPADYTQHSGLNLNGIAYVDGGALLTANTTTGALYRIATDTGAVTAVPGVSLPNADGLHYEDGKLWATLNRTNTLVRLTVSSAARSVAQDAVFTSPSLEIPTSVIRSGGHLLVTRSQYDKGGPFGAGTPLPFTVAEVDGF